MRGLRRSRKRRPELGQLAVDLDRVDGGAGKEVAEGAGDGAAGVAEDRDPPRRPPPRGRRQDQVPVPVVAGQVGAGPPERVHRLALVQLERAAAVGAFDHAGVLVGGLGLVEDAAGVGGLDRPDRDRQRQRQRAPGRAAKRQPSPSAATRASARAKTRKVRCVPSSGISSSAESIVPSSEPAVEIA